MRRNEYPVPDGSEVGKLLKDNVRNESRCVEVSPDGGEVLHVSDSDPFLEDRMPAVPEIVSRLPDRITCRIFSRPKAQ